MTTEQNNQMLKSGINWILLDNTFIGQTLTSDKFIGKFAPGSMLLVPNSTDDYCDYKLYFVDLNMKIHRVS